MTDERTARIWDRQSRTYDLFTGGQERRWATWKRDLFAEIAGHTLLVAAGTGRDIPFLPPRHEIVAVDISAGMLRRAEPRARRYDGAIELVQADVADLPFPAATFDTVLTSCTFCSVPDPVAGLRELHRVVRSGGRLLMFEHTDSRHWAIHPMLALMTLMTRHVARVTTELDRDTVGNVRAAGFAVERVTHLYLDVVKTIEAVRTA